jgi:hypothetical protein
MLCYDCGSDQKNSIVLYCVAAETAEPKEISTQLPKVNLA